MSDDWMERLREADGALRPTGSAGGEILERVRRGRRRRAVGVTAGAVASVAVLAVGFVVLPGLAGPWADDDPDAPAPATSGPTESTTPPSPQVFECPELNKVFHTEPVIPDQERQEAIVERIQETAWESFGVHHVAATPLGVFAFVEGDVDVARSILADEGVAHVYTWDRSGPEVGLDEEGQLSQAMNWVIDPAVRDVRRETRGIPGYGGIAFWRDRGGVLLQWREPIPQAVQALAGTRPDGVQVFVEGVAYSEFDIHQAGNRVAAAIRAGDVKADWTSSSGCGDNSGLVVGVDRETLGDRRAELQEQLAEIAGMPVMVVPEEPVVLL